MRAESDKALCYKSECCGFYSQWYQ